MFFFVGADKRLALQPIHLLAVGSEAVFAQVDETLQLSNHAVAVSVTVAPLMSNCWAHCMMKRRM